MEPLVNKVKKSLDKLGLVFIDNQHPKKKVGQSVMKHESNTPGLASKVSDRVASLPLFTGAPRALTGIFILAALAIGMTLMLSDSILQAQTAEQFFTYEENSPDPVAHFNADDPEDATPGWWSLTAAAVDLDGDGATDGATDVTAADIADRGLFKVDQDGELSFRTPRSYEDNSASFTSGSPAPTDKQYRVTVQYSDGLNTEYFEAYVTVTDVEEAGRVSFGLSGTGDASISVPLPETVVWQQFQPGAGLESRVVDPDFATRGNVVPTADITFKWYRVDADGEETLIEGATARTYSPVVEADVGHHIKVEATYIDDGATETVTHTSVNPVQGYRRPVDNKIPSFPSATVTRRVQENSDGAFGGPIPATDPDGDLLTYTVRGADASISFGVPRFAIDNATGRLMMAPGVRLNYEADNEYTVTVRAYDSAANNSGAATDPQVTVETTVTINVINVDEKPTFDTGTVPAGVVMAQTEGRTAIDLNNDTATESDDVATFVASDPDGRNVTLSLMGPDAAAFMLAADTVAGAGISQVLSFKEKTDFEMPADANMDNVYEVTVRASDGSMHTDRMLIIKVINDATEMGSVMLSADPVVGVELTASVTHAEGTVGASGEVANLKWQWQTADPAGTPATCTDSAVAWPADTMPATTGNIADATKSAYTPVTGDEDNCLRAVATYNYQFATAATTVESDGALVVVSNVNQPPKFAEGPRTFRVVKEDVVAADPNDDAIDDVATDNVGSPIIATDANGDTPVYTLSGATSFFRVRDNGQLEVKGKLDHEMRPSHRVTLMADDGSGESNARASITVTIYVTDVDEAPVIKDPAGTVTKQYQENGTGPVARLTATDPEGARPITWSLTNAAVTDPEVTADDIADRAFFEIDQNGVLSFKTPPNFEAAAGEGAAGDDDTYQVAVQASDGNNIGYHKLTVNVTNMEERGKITWTVTPSRGSAIAGLQQFKPGALLTPTVTDDDGPDPIVVTSWQWFRGSTRITGDDGTGATYTVVDADVGHRIRVVATYTDDGPAGPVETASFISPNPVQRATQAANTAPAFSNTAVTRRVAENSKGNVGAPVTATDPENDKLTYTLSGTDEASFKINPATGQIMVAATATLDYETATSHTVTVTATDSSGIVTATVATVTISVSNVNEKPTWGTDTPNDVIMAQTEGRTAIDLDNDTSTDTDVATFVASDPEGSKVSLSLMGTDAGAFELADDTDTGNGVSQVLSFKKKTDFEMPADSNRDNVYVVTVRASDGALHENRMLIIKVINDATEGGMVTLSGDAVVGVELTATLAHAEGSVAPSGEITGLKWQWQTADPAGTPATCTDATVSWPTDTAAATAGNIEDATKDMYTPVTANEGDCVRAVATYVYQFMPTDPATTAMSAGAMVLSNQAGQVPNQAPKFADGMSTFRVVAENAKPNAAADDAGTPDVDETTQGNIGSPVAAKDANGDTLAYTLGGADASLFNIVATSGQLQVKDPLNHEADPTHTVTVTANDNSGASNATASITVTIYVTDVDEKPAIMVGAAPSLTISGPMAEDYPENGTGAVATYTAMGIDAVASARWSLSGTDMGDFTLNTMSGGSVRLMFAASPDFENPTDANTDNVYMVTLTAMAGGHTATRDVQVTVTDVAENRPPDFGFATADRMVAENTPAGENIGTPVEATDPDNDALTYELGGADAADFAIDTATGQLKTRSALDYEAKSAYTVTVTARDVNGSPDDVTITINVTNVDEDGEVALSTGSATTTAVGVEITAMLTDPDGSVSGEAWQWQSSATMDGSYSDISGATSASYTPTNDDDGMYIMAMVSYTDGHGAGKSAMSDAVMVSAAAAMPLMARYDADSDGCIQLSEARAAVGDYFEEPRGTVLSLEDARKVVGFYFDCRSRQSQ